MPWPRLRPGAGTRMLVAWAVLATIGMVVASAQALMWGIAEPVYQARCTTDHPAELVARVVVNDSGASYPSFDACTVTSGRVPASLVVDRPAGTIAVTGMREARGPGADHSLDGRVGVLQYATYDSARIPGWVRVVDALAPLSSLGDSAWDAPAGGALVRAEQPVDAGSSDDAMFRLDDVDLDSIGEVQVVWLEPADADRAIRSERGASPPVNS